MKKHKYIRDILLMCVGTFLVSAATAVFLSPNKIVCGGVGGVSTILLHTTGIPISISYAFINVILLLFGYKTLGKEFTMKTIIGVGLVSFFTEILSHIPIGTDDPMLAVVFGGLAYGVGLGIVFVVGGTTGGTDILGRLIQYKSPAFSIGVLLMVLDAIVIIASLIVFGQFNLVLYGIIGVFLQTVALEMLIRQLNISKIAIIISDYGKEICDNIIDSFSRGVTILNALGGYSKNDKQVLLCALKTSEMNELQDRIKSIDPDAFVIFSEAQAILGNGFYVYK